MIHNQVMYSVNPKIDITVGHALSISKNTRDDTD